MIAHQQGALVSDLCDSDSTREFKCAMRFVEFAHLCYAHCSARGAEWVHHRNEPPRGGQIRNRYFMIRKHCEGLR